MNKDDFWFVMSLLPFVMIGIAIGATIGSSIKERVSPPTQQQQPANPDG